MKKVKKFTDVMIIAHAARRAGKKIVATNGCFDILHVGHVRNLTAAKKLGDMLIVGVNSDASVRINKGPSRPIISAHERAEMLAALESVDYVFIFGTKTPIPWIKKLRPDIHVKGGGEDVKRHPDFTRQKLIIEQDGGRFILLPHVAGKSTSKIIHRIMNT